MSGNLAVASASVAVHMAKGSSEIATAVRQGQEAAGEDRRAVLDSPSPGAGTGDADQVAPMVETDRIRGACFDDLFNLVVDPAFLRVAWEQVASNAGARTAGVDRVTVRSIEAVDRRGVFLADLRHVVENREFAPSPVRELMIPTPSSGWTRRLGIPTAADRVVRARLVLVLEPIYEADFHSSSYRFRPRQTSDGRGGRDPDVRILFL